MKQTTKEQNKLFVRTLAVAKSSTLASSGVKENVFPTTDGNVVENLILNNIIWFDLISILFYFILFYFII